jgi:hypothetical protein
MRAQIRHHNCTKTRTGSEMAWAALKVTPKVTRGVYV